MENWVDSLEIPDELKTDPNIIKYKSLEEALKGGVSAASRLGRSVVIPNDDSDPDEYNEFIEKVQRTANGKLVLHPDFAEGDHAAEFRKLLGVPDDPKGYEPPEDVTLAPEVIDQFKQMAAKAGLTTKQFKEQAKILQEQATLQQGQYEEARKADQAIIEQKLGLAKDTTLAEIKVLAAEHADPENPPTWLNDVSVLSSGDVLFLKNILDKFKGKGPQTFHQPSGDSLPTTDELNDKIAKKMKKLQGGRQTLSPAEYKQTQNEYVALLKMRGEVA